MKLLEQILCELGFDVLKSITFIPCGCCYLKSVKSVISFSSEKMTLSVADKTVTVEGENLEVGEYFEGDLLVTGDVRGIKID